MHVNARSCVAPLVHAIESNAGEGTFAGLKTIQTIVLINKIPVSNVNRAVGIPRRPLSVRSAAFEASAHASLAPHADAQEALAEEGNDANAAVNLLLKMQEEAKLVAVQGRARRSTTPQNQQCWSCDTHTHTAGQRQRQQQQQGKEDNHSQADEMQRSRASGNPTMAKAKGNPKGKGNYLEGHLRLDGGQCTYR
jgi:hypothetical protein